MLELSQTASSQEGRCLSINRIESRAHPSIKFWVLNTHLDVYDFTGVTRALQVDDILDIVNTIIPPTEPIILMGDFNSTRDQDTILKTSSVSHKLTHLKWIESHSKRGFYPRDTSPLSKLVAAGFQDVTDLVPNISIPVSVWSGTRVDFILVRGIRREQMLNTFAVFTSASDHLPIIADIDFSSLFTTGKKRARALDVDAPRSTSRKV